MWITLLGEPGAGKTTLGQSLEAAGRAVYVSGSEVLSRHIAGQPPGWEKLRNNKKAGKRADPRLTHDLLKIEIASIPLGTVVLLDGFPKSRSEVDLTEATLPSGSIDLAVLLEARHAVRLHRIEDRRVCLTCGLVVGDRLVPAEIHSSCRGELVSREDDHPEAVLHRHREDLTEPLTEYFEADGRLLRIDAERDPAQVRAEAIAAIESFRKNAN
jgi:adenylate kinase family enzyme